MARTQESAEDKIPPSTAATLFVGGLIAAFAGAALFLFPEPITSAAGIVLLVAGLITMAAGAGLLVWRLDL